MGAVAPVRGDWFKLTESESGFATHKGPDAWHPFIVKTAWPGPRVTLLPRSTTWPDGRPHAAHAGACGSAKCVLDECGRICIRLVFVDASRVVDFSCAEPDDDVIEWAMTVEPPDRPKRGRR